MAVKLSVSGDQPIDQIAEQDWDEILAINVKSMFLGLQVWQE